MRSGLVYTTCDVTQIALLAKVIPTVKYCWVSFTCQSSLDEYIQLPDWTSHAGVSYQLLTNERDKTLQFSLLADFDMLISV